MSSGMRPAAYGQDPEAEGPGQSAAARAYVQGSQADAYDQGAEAGGYEQGAAVVAYGPGAPTVTVASYSRYADAQRAVDRLSDQGFPVQHVTIVGTGLRLEEQVLGRLTIGRAASAGAGAGAWLGLLVGLLLGLFAVGAWLGVVVTAAVLGAVWGAILGAVAHAMTRGQRDFSSRSRLQASEYAVNVVQQFAEEARRRLDQLGSEQTIVPR